MLELPRLAPPPPRLMLDDPPWLKPPPPRPPPPRPPRASAASKAVRVARLRQAVNMARRKNLRRILLSRSLVRGQLNLLRIRARHEGEIGIGEGRIHLPRQVGDEGRPRRIVAIDDHDLARERLVALLDPELPVHILLAESIVVRRKAVDR